MSPQPNSPEQSGPVGPQHEAAPRAVSKEVTVAEDLGLVNGDFVVERSDGTRETGWTITGYDEKTGGVRIQKLGEVDDQGKVLQKPVHVSRLLAWQADSEANTDTIPRDQLLEAISKDLAQAGSVEQGESVDSAEAGAEQEASTEEIAKALHSLGEGLEAAAARAGSIDQSLTLTINKGRQLKESTTQVIRVLNNLENMLYDKRIIPDEYQRVIYGLRGAFENIADPGSRRAIIAGLDESQGIDVGIRRGLMIVAEQGAAAAQSADKDKKALPESRHGEVDASTHMLMGAVDHIDDTIRSYSLTVSARLGEAQQATEGLSTFTSNAEEAVDLLKRYIRSMAQGEGDRRPQVRGAVEDIKRYVGYIDRDIDSILRETRAAQDGLNVSSQKMRGLAEHVKSQAAGLNRK